MVKDHVDDEATKDSWILLAAHWVRRKIADFVVAPSSNWLLPVHRWTRLELGDFTTNQV